MCGFCTESAAFRDLLDAANGDPAEPRDPFLYPIYLQELPNWRTELSLWASVDHPRGALVALCRHWSERLAGNDAQPLKPILADRALRDLYKWLVTLDYPREWQWVRRIEGPPPARLPIELAMAKLDTYIEEWLGSSCSRAAIWDQKELYEHFLSVSVAFDIVAKCAADDSRLIKLATRAPRLTPSFNALDLWLQRRALYACVARFRVRFIDEYWEELRVEAVLSIVMGHLLNNRELTVMRAALQDRSHEPGDVGLPELLQAIQLRLK